MSKESARAKMDAIREEIEQQIAMRRATFGK